jgi:hypothetical protein
MSKKRYVLASAMAAVIASVTLGVAAEEAVRLEQTAFSIQRGA